ncbi:MAG: HAMP domain-containing protein [Ardenticatenaceae bacterium]|nr:HAMP domain-containing protein [Ardenticatenaceae bacterium]
MSKFTSTLTWFRTSIGAKIILPYLLLTLIVAGAGAFIVTQLVTGSLEERFNNQLLDAGRLVAEGMVNGEKERLTILRLISNTEGVATAIANEDGDALQELIPQLITTSDTDFATLLNQKGIEVFGWYRGPTQEEHSLRAGANFSSIPDVNMVLSGFDDGYGTKRSFVAFAEDGAMLFTIGPVIDQGNIVGVAMVGNHLSRITSRLAQSAFAKVTLYARDGEVLATSFVDPEQDVSGLLQEPETRYETIIGLLQTSSANEQVVTAVADGEVPLRQVRVLNQAYRLAYGDWRLRNQSYGLFSVALPSNFIVTAATNSRNLLSIVFSLATIAVITLGFFIASRILQPIDRLVEVSTAVSQGDLDQRTHINRADEIGTLAQSFDVMTERLVQRNRELLEQASKLEAILNSIADGVIFVNQDNEIITANPAAQPLLTTLNSANGHGANGNNTNHPTFNMLLDNQIPAPTPRHQIGSRVFSSTLSPVNTPVGDTLGRVIVLRDVTREAEAEHLKDGLITSISHELRTPLTSIKGYVELLKMAAQEKLSPNHLQFLDVVSSNTDKLINHVNKLIEISEIQEGSLQLHLDSLNIADVVQSSADRWQTRMADKGLTFAAVLRDSSMLMQGDYKRLAWALDNLLENAYHYTPAGGHVELHAYWDAAAHEARIDVTDTGIGINAVDLPYIFTRFFRAQRDEVFHEAGVGLGLFITKSLLEMQGGRIWVESKLNQGSTFHIALPGEMESVYA